MLLTSGRASVGKPTSRVSGSSPVCSMKTRALGEVLVQDELDHLGPHGDFGARAIGARSIAERFRGLGDVRLRVRTARGGLRSWFTLFGSVPLGQLGQRSMTDRLVGSPRNGTTGTAAVRPSGPWASRSPFRQSLRGPCVGGSRAPGSRTPLSDEPALAAFVASTFRSKGYRSRAGSGRSRRWGRRSGGDGELVLDEAWRAAAAGSSSKRTRKVAR